MTTRRFLALLAIAMTLAILVGLAVRLATGDTSTSYLAYAVTFFILTALGCGLRARP